MTTKTLILTTGHAGRKGGGQFKSIFEVKPREAPGKPLLFFYVEYFFFPTVFTFSTQHAIHSTSLPLFCSLART